MLGSSCRTSGLESNEYEANEKMADKHACCTKAQSLGLWKIFDSSKYRSSDKFDD
ncbi:MAG: hypothetical protein WAqPseu_40920 [Shewanella algae]